MTPRRVALLVGAVVALTVVLELVRTPTVEVREAGAHDGPSQGVRVAALRGDVSAAATGTGHASTWPTVHGAGTLRYAGDVQPAVVGGECVTDVAYHPSPWETDWTANVDSYAADDAIKWEPGCTKMINAKAKVDEWLRYWNVREIKATTEAGAKEWDDQVFSSFVTWELCPGAAPRAIFREPIEPLVGFLRHPGAFCLEDRAALVKMWRTPKQFSKAMKKLTTAAHSDDYLLLSKDYMLLPFPGAPGPRRSGKHILFDAGASSYLAGTGGASQVWFIEAYRRRGIEFDRIIAWEAKGSQPALIADHPPDILTKLSYFAVPISDGVDGKHSVLRFIQDLCKVEDFCVFKLDVDTSAVEVPIANMLAETPALTELVDEFFFEHHTKRNPMYGGKMKTHWKDNVVADQDITDSYRIFSKLRHAGVRAHSWV